MALTTKGLTFETVVGGGGELDKPEGFPLLLEFEAFEESEEFGFLGTKISATISAACLFSIRVLVRGVRGESSCELIDCGERFANFGAEDTLE